MCCVVYMRSEKGIFKGFGSLHNWKKTQETPDFQRRDCFPNQASAVVFSCNLDILAFCCVLHALVFSLSRAEYIKSKTVNFEVRVFHVPKAQSFLSTF